MNSGHNKWDHFIISKIQEQNDEWAPPRITTQERKSLFPQQTLPFVMSGMFVVWDRSASSGCPGFCPFQLKVLGDSKLLRACLPWLASLSITAKPGWRKMKGLHICIKSYTILSKIQKDEGYLCYLEGVITQSKKIRIFHFKDISIFTDI